MTWQTGNIVSTSPASALRSQVEQILQQEGGWTLVDTHIISSNSYRVWHRNAANYPFYVIMKVRTDAEATSNSFQVALCEGYDTANHQAIRPAPQDNNPANVAPDGSKGAGTGYNLNDTTAIYYTRTGALPTSGYSYIIQARPTHLYVAAWAGPSRYAGIYAGKFYPLFSDPYPVVISERLGYNASTTGRDVAFTRQVGVPPASGTSGEGAWNGVAGQESHDTGATGDPVSKATWPVNPSVNISRLRFSIRIRNYENTNNIWIARGTAYDIMALHGSTGYTTGDRLTVGGIEKYFVIVGGNSVAVEEI